MLISNHAGLKCPWYVYEQCAVISHVFYNYCIVKHSLSVIYQCLFIMRCIILEQRFPPTLKNNLRFFGFSVMPWNCKQDCMACEYLLISQQRDLRPGNHLGVGIEWVIVAKTNKSACEWSLFFQLKVQLLLIWISMIYASVGFECIISSD